MPTNRTRRARAPSPDALTPEVLAAWKRADFRELHRVLGLLPCEPGPLPSPPFAYGCREGPPPAGLQAVLARRLASGARASEGVARGRRRTWGATLTVQLDSADARVTSPRSRRAEL
jgi:hypothetical protein